MREVIEGKRDAEHDMLKMFGFQLQIVNEIAPCHKIIQVTFSREKKSMVETEQLPVFGSNPTRNEAKRTFLLSYIKSDHDQYVSFFSLDERAHRINSDVSIIFRQNDESSMLQAVTEQDEDDDSMIIQKPSQLPFQAAMALSGERHDFYNSGEGSNSQQDSSFRQENEEPTLEI